MLDVIDHLFVGGMKNRQEEEKRRIVHADVLWIQSVSGSFEKMCA